MMMLYTDVPSGSFLSPRLQQRREGKPNRENERM
jgi:hypothetical protein